MLRADAVILATLTALNVILALPAFRPGIIADNDFVGHYAYARFLVDQLWPAAGTHLGWCPWFNAGHPFLLFNTPPLVPVLGALGTIAGLSPLVSLKLWLVVGFVAVPLLAYRLARSVPGLPRSHPISVALLASLFSSELFGLEFFFS